MKAWVLHEINKIQYEELEKPVLGRNEVLVAVKAVGICGSDIPRIYQTGAHVHPLVPGHEFSGVVEATGTDVDAAWRGKRVGIFPLIPCRSCQPCRNKQYEMCRHYDYLGSRRHGGFAEYVNVPVECLVELPDNVSFAEAAMLEPMAVAVHAMRRAFPEMKYAGGQAEPAKDGMENVKERVTGEQITQKETALEVRVAQKETEPEVQAAQKETEAEVQAAQKETEAEVQAAQKETEPEVQVAQMATEREVRATRTVTVPEVQVTQTAAEPEEQASKAAAGLADQTTEKQKKPEWRAEGAEISDTVGTVVVCGLGTIGLLLLMMLLERRTGETGNLKRSKTSDTGECTGRAEQADTDIFVIGNKDFQKKMVLELGLPEEAYCDSRQQDAGEWLMEQTEKRGADIFFECVGKNETLQLAVDNAAPGGRICLVGNPYSDMQLEKSVYWKILRNQLTLMGNWNSSFTREPEDDWAYVLRLLSRKRIMPEKLITHRFPLAELEKGFHIMRDKSEDYVKIMCFPT